MHLLLGMEIKAEAYSSIILLVCFAQYVLILATVLS